MKEKLVSIDEAYKELLIAILPEAKYKKVFRRGCYEKAHALFQGISDHSLGACKSLGIHSDDRTLTIDMLVTGKLISFEACPYLLQAIALSKDLMIEHTDEGTHITLTFHLYEWQHDKSSYTVEK